MAVTYTKAQKDTAKKDGLHLVTIAAAGMEFQGATTEEERDELLKYILAFVQRRREWLKTKDTPKEGD